MSRTQVTSRRRALALAGRVVAWTVIVGCGAALLAAVVVPRLSGATPYTVLTGSMRPDLPPGTLVVVRPVDPGSLRIGDVITYQRESGKSSVVTHRVVSVGVQADGDRVLQTQGDANDVADEAPVREVQVRGRVWYSVPHLGRVGTALENAQRETAAYVVAAGLLVYAGWMFASSVVGRKKKSSPREKEDAT